MRRCRGWRAFWLWWGCGGVFIRVGVRGFAFKIWGVSESIYVVYMRCVIIDENQDFSYFFMSIWDGESTYVHPISIIDSQ